MGVVCNGIPPAFSAVSSSPEENRRRSAGEVGQDEGGAEQGCLDLHSP